MTERKPTNMTVGNWVDQQIRDAEARGEFADLPGSGKPLAGLDKPRTGMEWAAEQARRNNIDMSALLPPALALRKELEDLPERLAKENSEERVRKYLEQLNANIREEHRRPQFGPPLRAGTVDIEAAVEQWRTAREERLARARIQAREALAEAGLLREEQPPKPRWWRRRSP